MEQSASLFGDFDVTLNTAGRPVIHPAVPWFDIVKLEKERDLVGMYLSAHPLDPYYMELTHGCSTTLKDFSEKNDIVEDRDISFGGMVISFEERPSKKGDMYGRLKIEDYTGSAELMLFGQDFIKYANFGKIGTSIYVTGRYAKSYNGELRFKITDIKLLSAMKGQILNSITISLDKADINDALIDTLMEHISDSTTDRGALNFKIFDAEANRAVTMSSDMRIPLNRKLANLLDDLNIEYNFN